MRETLEKIREENLRPKHANDSFYGDSPAPTPMQAMAGQERRPTPCEEAEKRAAHHYAEADRAGKAADFLHAHPEFGEFVELIRAGVIGI
jgi:phosphoserine phosphatase